MARRRDRRTFGADPPHGVDQLLAGAVVEGDGEQHPRVRRRVGDRLADGALDVLRRARVGGVERPADPLDAHVQVVELGDPPEQLGVQAEDVADLGARPDPVLGREPEHGQPADVAAHGDAHEAGEVLLALRVPLRAGQAAAPGPAPVAVHDAGDVQRRVGGRHREQRRWTRCRQRYGRGARRHPRPWTFGRWVSDQSQNAPDRSHQAHPACRPWRADRAKLGDDGFVARARDGRGGHPS